jgi:hypothetical protein
VKVKKRFAMAAVATVFLLLPVISGCSPKIKGWSQESFRNPGFNNEALLHETLALFPVMVLEAPGEKPGKPVEMTPPAPYTPEGRLDVTGDQKPSDPRELYRIILDEMLLNELQKRHPSFQLVTPGDVLKRFNDKGLAAAYEKFTWGFTRTGFDDDLLKRFGEALGCRYLLISQAVVTEYKSEASYTLVWTFGRKSTLRAVKISSQLWDTRSGSQIWEGSGVGYNRLSLYEGAPLLEDMAGQAVDRLLDAIVPAPPRK